MPFPSPPGSTDRVVQLDTGVWSCAQCGFTNDNHQVVIGHLGKHKENKRKPGPKKTDPLNMTFSQMVDALDELTKKNAQLTTALRVEMTRNNRIRAALSDFMGTGADESRTA